MGIVYQKLCTPSPIRRLPSETRSLSGEGHRSVAPTSPLGRAGGPRVTLSESHVSDLMPPCGSLSPRETSPPFRSGSTSPEEGGPPPSHYAGGRGRGRVKILLENIRQLKGRIHQVK
jgi:hypothetical protein